VAAQDDASDAFGDAVDEAEDAAEDLAEDAEEALEDAEDDAEEADEAEDAEEAAEEVADVVVEKKEAGKTLAEQKEEEDFWILMIGITSVVDVVWWIVFGWFVYIPNSTNDPTMFVNSDGT